MPVIKYKKKIQKITKKPIFQVVDLVNQNIPHNYAKKTLYELHKSKKISRVERGKYTTYDDIITIATHITEPCYLSMWSALSIHKLTTQIPFTIEIITTRKRFNKQITYKDTPIIFYNIKPEMMYGFENIIRKEEIRVPIAKPEKTIIDILYFKSINNEEIEEIINKIDKKTLLSYAKLSHKKYIIKKVKELIKC